MIKKKWLLFLVLLIIPADYVSSSEFTDKFDKSIISMRTNQNSCYQMIKLLDDDLSLNPGSCEKNWKLAVAYYFYGDVYEINIEKKKQYFMKCRDYAQIAVNINPRSIDAQYWLGVGYAMWSTANGLLESLFNVDNILKQMNNVIAIDPAYFSGFAWAVKARVYFALPGYKEKAYQDILTAFKYGPNYRAIYQVYAEMLFLDKKYDESRKVIAKGMAIPYDPASEIEEKMAMTYMSNYLKAMDN